MGRVSCTTPCSGTAKRTNAAVSADRPPKTANRPRHPIACELAKPGLRKVYTKLAQDPDKAKRMDAAGGVEKMVIHDAKVLIDSIYQMTFGDENTHKFFEPYTVSFCGHSDAYERENGLLSQWRGYGGDLGFAIVFNTKALEDLLLREVQLHAYDLGGLGDVVYAGDDKNCKREFPDLIVAIEQALPRLFDKTAVSFNELYSAFVTSVSRYKHQGFKEEQEVRLFLSPRDEALSVKLKEIDPTYADTHKGKKPKPILIKGNGRPYIDVFGDIEKHQLPIKHIIVGPHREKAARREEMIQYLKTKKLNITVSCSRTPFI